MTQLIYQDREIILTQQDILFLLINITDQGRKDLEDKLFWILSGSKNLHE